MIWLLSILPINNIFLILINIYIEPSGVQALKNPNPLKDVEGLAELAVAELS